MPGPLVLDCPVPTVIAHVVRGDFPESVHHGVVVGLTSDGREAFGAGEAEMTLFPRSALKLPQAVAMVRAGLRPWTSHPSPARGPRPPAAAGAGVHSTTATTS